MQCCEKCVHFCNSAGMFCSVQCKMKTYKMCFTRDALNVNNKSPKWNNNQLCESKHYGIIEGRVVCNFSCNARTLLRSLCSAQSLTHFVALFFFCFSITGNSETKSNLFFHPFFCPVQFFPSLQQHRFNLKCASFSSVSFFFINTFYIANKCWILPAFHLRIHLWRLHLCDWYNSL